MRAVLAKKQAPWPSPCPAKATLQKGLAFFLECRWGGIAATRARARLLHKASHQIARAKQELASSATAKSGEIRDFVTTTPSSSSSLHNVK